MPRKHTFADIVVTALLLCGCPGPEPEAADNADGSSGSTGAAPTQVPPTPGSTGVSSPASEATTETDPPPDESSGGGDDPIEPGADTAVVLFDDAHVFFSGWDRGQNARAVDIAVTFPDAEPGYTSLDLELRLRCPDGACDWWDRKGYLGVVEDVGTEDERVIELARFVTPYRVEGSWSLDVTALRPLLVGERTIRVFIDTWVGPGHPNGNGWLVDAAIRFGGGVPDERPVQVLPLWGPTDVPVGDPDMPPDSVAVPVTVPISPTASRVELHASITGHGQGNASNCAEFCPLEHGFAVGENAIQRSIWRDDCGDNPISDQQGTWTLSRAGWCPGDIVSPWVEDVTDLVRSAEEVTISYGLQDYENTCRPAAPVCMGCALGSDCEYNDSNHTPPTMLMSAALVVYETVSP